MPALIPLAFIFSFIALIIWSEAHLSIKRYFKMRSLGIPSAPADPLNVAGGSGWNPLLGHLPAIARHGSLVRYQYYALMRILKDNGVLEGEKLEKSSFLLGITAIRNMLVITEPESIIQILLTKNYPKDDYAPLRPLLGDGLLTSEGDRWKNRRRVFNHGFKPEFLRTMAPGMSKITELLCQVLHAHAILHPDEPIDLAEVLTRSTIDIIGLVGFNHEFNFTQDLLDCIKKGKNSTEAVLQLVQDNLSEPNEKFRNPLRKWTHPRHTRHYEKQLEIFLDMGRGIVEKALNDPNTDASSILGLMVKLGRESTDDQLDAKALLDEVNTFLVAGNETTASSASFFVRLLNLYPETLKDVRQEIDMVMGDASPLPTKQYPPGELPVHACTFDDQEKMPLLWNHLREVLRLYPVAPGSVRVFPDCNDTIQGMNLPEGTKLFVPYYTMHRRPDLWGKDSGEYDPTRWNDETRLPSPRIMLGTYMPFALGPRTCIGNNFAKIEFRIIMATLLRYFDFKVVVPKEEQDEIDKVQMEAQLLAKEGMSGVNPDGKELVFHEAITLRPKSCLVKVKIRS